MSNQKLALTHRFHSAGVIQLAEQLIKHADHVMTKQWGLSYAQFKVLAVLSKSSNTSQQMIAECLDLTPAAISRLSESLLLKKLVSRHTKANNRRQNVVTITEAGKQVMAECIEMITVLEKKLYGDISDQEITTFKKILNSLLTKMNHS